MNCRIVNVWCWTLPMQCLFYLFTVDIANKCYSTHQVDLNSFVVKPSFAANIKTAIMKELTSIHLCVLSL